jgi:hypothetical protein
MSTSWPNNPDETEGDAHPLWFLERVACSKGFVQLMKAQVLIRRNTARRRFDAEASPDLQHVKNAVIKLHVLRISHGPLLYLEKLPQ